MATFDFTFTVQAPISSVAELHRDTHALKQLTPPPVWVQIHHVEPMAEGSISRFTLWFGFLPIPWTARHFNVTVENGFSDTQIEGPMQRWVHSHTFFEADGGSTQVHDHIEYEHYKGLRGLKSRLLFTPFGLWMTFCYRRFAVRRLLEKGCVPAPLSHG